MVLEVEIYNEKTLQIYVALPGERVDVWRPVVAIYVKENIYKILDQPYERAIEKWQFKPGQLVVCNIIEASEGPILAATGKG